MHNVDSKIDVKKERRLKKVQKRLKFIEKLKRKKERKLLGSTSCPSDVN